jgi:AmiR/NasT family two-component response regulator
MHARAELESLARDLETALRSRAVIDEAKGVVMATLGCTPDEAFAFLAGKSQAKNIKVRDLAARIVADPAEFLAIVR